MDNVGVQNTMFMCWSVWMSNECPCVGQCRCPMDITKTYILVVQGLIPYGQNATCSGKGENSLAPRVISLIRHLPVFL